MTVPSGAPAGDLIDRVLGEVGVELREAMERHGPMRSGHEGFAVILEEVDELEEAIAVAVGEMEAASMVTGLRAALANIWTAVRADRGDMDAARFEAIQVAAMAVRYVLDVCGEADRPAPPGMRLVPSGEAQDIEAFYRLEDAVAARIDFGAGPVRVWNSNGIEGEGPTLAAAVRASDARGS